MRLRTPFGSEQVDGRVKSGIVELAGPEADLYLARVDKDRVEIVPAIARVGANLAPARAHGAFGVPPEHPIAHVDDVDVLLDNDVAGKRALPNPVAQPLLHGRGVGPIGPVKVPAVVVSQAASDLADCAVMDAARQLHYGRRHANLKSHVETQLALRLLADANDVMGAGNVHGHRLLAIDVLAGLHDRLEMLRMEVGRSGDKNEIHFFRGGDFLVSVGAFKELCGVEGRVSFRLLDFVEVLAGRLQLVAEQIGEGGDARTGILDETRAYDRTAPSAAEDSKTNLGVRRRPPHKPRLHDHKTCCRGCP
jgi:hypothetical protein